jgi:hypothetical protein
MSTPSAMPSKFRPITAETGRFPWISWKPGLTVQGILLGRFQRRGEGAKHDDGTPAYYYQIRLTEPSTGKVTADGEDESKEVPVEVGSIVNVDEKKQLEELASLVRSKRKYEVWIKAASKVKIRGTSRSVWQFEPIGAHELPVEGAETDEDGDEDEVEKDGNIPF